MMNLLGTTKREIIQDEKGKNMPRLKIAEIVLVNCNIFNSDYQDNSRFMHTSVANRSLVTC